ncbi:MAG: hypothetical protein ACJAVN_001301 [Roseivirga sp.]|jgi:hypothetical protein
MSHYFETLHLMLEHEDQNFAYLMEMNINRSHSVGAYPIEIKINGLMREFKAEPGENQESVRAKMKTRFASQEIFDSFVNGQHMSFETFVNDLGTRVRKHMKVDGVKVEIDKRVVMPKSKDRQPISKGRRKNPTRDYDPVFDGYNGFGEILLYSFLLSELLLDDHMYVSDVTLIGEEADSFESVADVSDSGDWFDMGDFDGIDI